MTLFFADHLVSMPRVQRHAVAKPRHAQHTSVAYWHSPRALAGMHRHEQGDGGGTRGRRDRQPLFCRHHRSGPGAFCEGNLQGGVGLVAGGGQTRMTKMFYRSDQHSHLLPRCSRFSLALPSRQEGPKGMQHSLEASPPPTWPSTQGQRFRRRR